MIQIILLFIILIIYYQNYQVYDYPLYEGNHILLNCPEKYEIGIGESGCIETSL